MIVVLVDISYQRFTKDYLLVRSSVRPAPIHRFAPCAAMLSKNLLEVPKNNFARFLQTGRHHPMSARKGCAVGQGGSNT